MLCVTAQHTFTACLTGNVLLHWKSLNPGREMSPVGNCPGREMSGRDLSRSGNVQSGNVRLRNVDWEMSVGKCPIGKCMFPIFDILFWSIGERGPKG